MDKMPTVASVNDKLYEYHMSEEAVRHSAAVSANPSPDQRASGSRGLDAQKALHSQYVLQLLQLQRRAGFLCDITIHVRDKSFRAHKPLLAACSLYFRALFSDVTTKDSTALNLNSLTPAGFEILLEYIYSGSLAITSENSSEVLSAATCLQMTNVVETCLNFMRSSFRMSKNASVPAVNGVPPPVAVFSPRRNDGAPQQFISPRDIGAKPQGLVDSKIKDNFFQNNLQILSTSSINEDEFRSMVGRSFSQGRTMSLDSQSSSVSGRTSTTPSVLRQSQNVIPSTSQLQSVLPFLIENNAVQPTPEDVQRLLNKLPTNANKESPGLRLPEQHPPTLSLARSVHNSIQPNNGVPLINTTNVNGASQSFVISRVSEFHPSSLNEPNLPQLSTTASRSLNIDERTGLDLTTVSAGATDYNHTPEHHSGANQTAFQNRDEIAGKERRRSLDATEFVSAPSSDDQDTQSVEISDPEEDHGGRAWSTDRSEYQNSTTDLSGTPCPSNEHERADDLTGTSKSMGALGSPPSDARKGVLETLDGGRDTFMTSITNDKPLKVTLRRCASLPPTNKDDGSSVTDNESYRSNSVVPSETTSEITRPHHKLVSSNDQPSSTQKFDTESKVNFLGISPESLKHEQEDTDNAFPVREGSDSDPIVQSELVLDLSVCARKRSLDQQNDHPELNIKVSRTLSVPDGTFVSGQKPKSDPGIQLAADALSLLRQSQPNAYPGAMQISPSIAARQQPYNRMPNHFSMSSNEMADDGITYSRKPRRTTGGQTCTWPGCGRLFRHRNIYEEHQRLHELGIPVSQLRKCYMGARVKKTVREQLEELRTDSGEGDSSGQQKGRKKKSITGGQETIRKRVTIKDRMDPLQVYSNVVSQSPLEGRLPSTFAHPSQLNTRLVQPSPSIMPCSIPLICPNSSPQFTPPKQVHLNNHGASQLVQVMGADGVVRLLQPPSSPIHQQRMPNNQSSLTANQAVTFPPLGNTDRAPRDVNPPINSQMNPVEATLALLGIPTPVRRGDHNSTNTILSGLSLEQIRRRLALRETSDDVTCSLLPSAGGPSSVSSVQTISSLGQSLASLVPESAIRPGNVTGTLPYTNLVGSAFSAAHSSGAPHAASNADNEDSSIPNQYPLTSPARTSHPGSQV